VIGSRVGRRLSANTDAVLMTKAIAVARATITTAVGLARAIGAGR
jgi:thiazole synthase ThiGH ThiG subunit